VPDPSKEANIEPHFDAKNRVNKSDCVDQKDGRDMRTNLSLAFELSPLVGHVAPLARKLQKLLLDFSVLHLAGTQFALLRPGAIFFRLGHDRRPFVRYMANTSGQQNVPPGRGRGCDWVYSRRQHFANAAIAASRGESFTVLADTPPSSARGCR
jgi:hypothetical protein